MKRAVIIMCVLNLMLGGTATVVYAESIPIVINPSVINLKSHANWVTVHADIPFNEVVEGTVYLEGIAAAFIKEDDIGDLVAKFSASEVKEIISPGKVDLELTGESTLGPFEGIDTIYVIDRGYKQ